MRRSSQYIWRKGWWIYNLYKIVFLCLLPKKYFKSWIRIGFEQISAAATNVSDRVEVAILRLEIWSHFKRNHFEGNCSCPCRNCSRYLKITFTEHWFSSKVKWQTFFSPNIILVYKFLLGNKKNHVCSKIHIFCKRNLL